MSINMLILLQNPRSCIHLTQLKQEIVGKGGEKVTWLMSLQQTESWIYFQQSEVNLKKAISQSNATLLFLFLGNSFVRGLK